MKEVVVISKIVKRGGAETIPAAPSQGGGSSAIVDGLNKTFFDRLFVAVDDNGNELQANDITTPIAYILARYNFASTGGVTFYAKDKSVKIETIAESLPFDGSTIKYNAETGLIEVIGGTGGGTGGTGGEGGEAQKTTEAEILAMGFTKNQGTITGVKMNGVYRGTSGVVDLGTVITSHQSLADYVNDVKTSGTGNAVTGFTKSGNQLTLNKGLTFLTEHQDLSGYQKKITTANKLSYQLIDGTPDLSKYVQEYELDAINEALNDKANTATTLSGYGITDAKISNGKIILGSATITPLTSHQTIYTLTFQSGSFSSTSFTANTADNTISIPTSADHIADGEIHEFFTKQKAIDALADTLKNYVNLSEDQEIEGVKTFKNGLKGTNWEISSDSYGNPYVKFGNDWYVKYTNNTMVVGKNNAQLVINQNGYVEISGGAEIHGNLLVNGGVTFHSTNGQSTQFLLDAAKIEDINSTSTTQVYTANTVRILKEELAKAEEKADVCERKLDNLKNSILAALAGINKSSSAMTIGGALNTLYNYINEE